MYCIIQSLYIRVTFKNRNGVLTNLTNNIMKAYQFEIYTIDSVSGQTGWEIVNRTVFAESKAEAREQLKQTPLFDCVILFNYCVEVDMANLSAKQLAVIETGYTDEDLLF